MCSCFDYFIRWLFDEDDEHDLNEIVIIEKYV